MWGPSCVMVHIKNIELSYFKSFGGTTSVPFLPGFTVVSGPNGSGKSNILDALLFCLSLSSSKGMRAERLPDLINHKQARQKGASETSVSVTFDLTDLPNRREILPPEQTEWTVTRRLRVTQGGSYASTYSVNGEVCTASELYEQLTRLRIYPEGYNVVLQGDVTRIITMNGRERRGIIDELAGVAEFDRKIDQTKATLDQVKEREERFRLIEQELRHSLEKLDGDRRKAEKYQQLKAQLHTHQLREQVLVWRSLQLQEEQLEWDIAQGARERTTHTEKLEALAKELAATKAQLDDLNRQVKALGEDEQLSLASRLATQKAKQAQELAQQQQWTLRSQKLQQLQDELTQALAQGHQEQQRCHQALALLEADTLPQLSDRRHQAAQTLSDRRREAETLAASAEAWVQEQNGLSRAIAQLQREINPQRTEQAQLGERITQLQENLTAHREQLAQVTAEIEALAPENPQTLTPTQTQIQELAQALATLESELQLEEQTYQRLLKEQQEQQRHLDRLEAKNQAQQEAQGTHASKIILKANLEGVCGLVAQLGQVEPQYQLAVEIAAGGRLGFLVVENEAIAAQGINLLKQRRGGRATFLPLTKIRAPHINNNLFPPGTPGYVDLALNLMDFEERYRPIFAYVLGNTAVFEDLTTARSQLGKARIVTLQGELLESSGAMTGGSRPSGAGSLHFGKVATGESEEMRSVRQRLADIGEILDLNRRNLEQQRDRQRELTLALGEQRQRQREQELQQQQQQRDRDRLNGQRAQLENQLAKYEQDLATAQARETTLNLSLPPLEAQLRSHQQQLEELETGQSHGEWQEIQKLITRQEAQLQEAEQALQGAQNQAQALTLQVQQLTTKNQERETQLQEHRQEQGAIAQQQQHTTAQLQQYATDIEALQRELDRLALTLGDKKQQRDHQEQRHQQQQQQQQKLQWQLEKLHTQQQERNLKLAQIREELAQKTDELPAIAPEISAQIPEFTAELPQARAQLQEALDTEQQKIQRLQRKITALEPVNMLALEEYQQTEERLGDLSQKLEQINQERLELLNRIEKFTTSRLQAFKEAFDAVNRNFQDIFATLSQGDGYLQLDRPEDPFAGGLNLVAHPKGKPVQRLSSMSGGEKSLTALSFIFALQRYRPSPFYAFDEVDMFLDGANVERLSSMIKQQAQGAQFIVVSLRRPMIEASERTIGVTQARGAHTQVLGIKLV